MDRLNKWKQYTLKEKVLMISIYIFLIFVLIITFYPFWYVFIVSINNASDTMKGGLLLLPRQLSFESYKRVLSDVEILQATKITVLRTIIGTTLSLAMTTMLAFVLSHRDLVGRKFWNLLFVFTMYFGGGLIPSYMVIKSYNLIDSFWVYIIPGLISTFNMIILRTYMEELPAELSESATIDGANDLVIFTRIILPLSKPVIATVALFIAVGHWNAWFDSHIYTYREELKTLPAVLVKVLNQFQSGAFATTAQQMANTQLRTAVSSESIRMTTTMVATLPIIMVYPFIQKYFVKGIMLGAIKS